MGLRFHLYLLFLKMMKLFLLRITENLIVHESFQAFAVMLRSLKLEFEALPVVHYFDFFVLDVRVWHPLRTRYYFALDCLGFASVTDFSFLFFNLGIVIFNPASFINSRTLSEESVFFTLNFLSKNSK